MACLTLDDPLPVFGGEAVFSGDKVIAQTTSGNFGYSVGKSLVLAYIPVERLEASDFSIEAFGERVSATLHSGAVYDPKREKILC